MSKKISQMPPKASMVDADEFTILDSADPSPDTKNKRVLKSVALSGLATQAAVDTVQSNLDTHAAGSVATAHPDGVTQTDLSNHKTAANQHPTSGVTGLDAALASKANTADLGTAATRDVGVGAGDVAQGDAPAGAVTTHETTYAHGNLPTAAQKAALDANATLSGANAVAGANDLPTADQQAAMDAANAPTGLNPFRTAADAPSAHAASHAASQSDEITPAAIAAATAAQGTLADSAVQPGDDAATLGSGAATNGQVLTANGIGGTSWASPGAGGDIDGAEAIDWKLREQALGTLGAGTSAVDLDAGHHITATLTADRTFNFTSGRGHATTQWTATIATGGNTPTWQFGGAAIDLPADYDIATDSPQRIEFSFVRSSLGISVAERRIP